MNLFVSRVLNRKLSCSSPSQVNPFFLRSHLLHSASGDEAYRRRNDGGYSFSSYLSRRHYDEDNRNVKITVWWDFENCNIPIGVNPHRVGNRITSAIRSSGIKGPVTINAFGDVAQLPRTTQEALTSTGISLTHVPHNGKNSADRSIMADIVCWVSQNPPPAHFFLISSDSDFANILHRLRMINYNIFISCTGTASRVLCSAATVMWPWNGLVKGENVPLRYFNNPPDGLYGSWYGHYKRVLDDPFEDTDSPPTSQPEESMEPISEPKIRRVPKAVVNGILQVLHSYPEGISLSVLRTELKRNNIIIDKDFYGHKNFSQFLGSLNLLKVLSPLVVGGQLPVGDGQPPVGGGQSGTLKKEAEKPDVSSNPHKDVYTNGSTLKGGDCIMDKDSILTDQLPNCKGRNLDTNGSAASSFKDDHPMADLEARESPSVSRPTIVDSCDDSQKRDNIIAKGGLIFLLWNSLTGHRVDSILKKDDNVFELRRHEFSSKMVLNLHSSDLSKDVKPKDEAVDVNNLVSQKDNYEINSVDANKAITKDINPGQSEKPNLVYERKVNLLGRIVKGCKSLIYGASDHADHSESGVKVHKIDAVCKSGNASFSRVFPEAHELFTEPSFWNDLESFLLDPKVGQLILKSRTREQLLQRLQNEGPSSLKKLDDCDLSRLCHILIAEKKWVEESPSQKFPYKLVIPSKNNAISSLSSHLNGLCSLSPVKTKPNSDKQSVQEKADLGVISTAPCNLTELRLWFRKHFNCGGNIEPEEFQNVFKDEFNQNLCCSLYGYSNISSLIEACSCKKPGPRRRDEALDDCRKLLKELLEKNPTGFHISIFQPAFLQKYDYVLDYSSLGYPKLMKLLEIMPGTKIENNYARPSEEQVTDTSKEEDYEAKDFQVENGNVDDSAWAELGPLSSSTNHGNGKDRKMDKKATFIPVSLSDEEYTDSEEEATPMPPKRSYRDNSLLIKILDSWDNNREGGVKRQHEDTNGTVVDCSRNSFQTKQRTLNVRTERLQRLKLRASPKCFSFTTKDADDKEYFAKSILSELSKAGDLKVKEPSR